MTMDLVPGNVASLISADAVRERGQSVQRALLGNQIAESLRKDILLGVIRPGTKLSQQRLCEQFGTSRMPVRDGLRVLARDGLVVTDAGQHTIVAPLSRADLLDSYYIEGRLAGMAAVRASARASDDQLAVLDSLHVGMLESAASNDHQLMAQLNWALHRNINRMSGSRKLLSAIRAVSLDLPRDYLMEMPEWSVRSNDEHARFLAAMAAKQHDEVGELVAAHIVESGRGLLAYLESQGLELD